MAGFRVEPGKYEPEVMEAMGPVPIWTVYKHLLISGAQAGSFFGLLSGAAYAAFKSGFEDKAALKAGAIEGSKWGAAIGAGVAAGMGTVTFTRLGFEADAIEDRAYRLTQNRTLCRWDRMALTGGVLGTALHAYNKEPLVDGLTVGMAAGTALHLLEKAVIRTEVIPVPGCPERS